MYVNYNADRKRLSEDIDVNENLLSSKVCDSIYQITQTENFRKHALSHISSVGLAFLSLSLFVGAESAVAVNSAEAVNSTASIETSKDAINSILKASRQKPAMLVATTIVCTACIPAAGAAFSPALCVACGLLFAKTFG